MTRASKAKEAHAGRQERRPRATTRAPLYRSAKLWGAVIAVAVAAVAVVLVLRRPAAQSRSTDQRQSGAPVPLSEAAQANPADAGPRRTAVPDSRMINVSDDPVKGPADAPVRIVEFADFQCPSCGQFFLNTEGSLTALYGDRIQWAFLDFPLDQHERAIPAALAAQCAQMQGKFWPYHDLLFRNQERLSDADLRAYAKDAGLDVNRWQTCYDKQEGKPAVQEDVELGRELGVDATPTFYVGGQILKGAMPITSFMEIIDPILQQQAAAGSPGQAPGAAGATSPASPTASPTGAAPGATPDSTSTPTDTTGR